MPNCTLREAVAKPGGGRSGPVREDVQADAREGERPLYPILREGIQYNILLLLNSATKYVIYY